jgi:type VI secretion system secreted protein VgrG
MVNKNRNVSVKTPLGAEEFIFQSMSGSEEMGRLFEFEIELIREQSKGTVDISKMLGKHITLTLDMPDTSVRYFNGMVVQFKHTGFVEGFYCYRATLKPSLWFLSRRANCRVFQEKNVPDIIKAVLKDHAYVDVEHKTQGSYATLDYCVQYRESDFNFISRLMEEVGIFYYFKHSDGKHTMVITDSGSNYQSVSGYTTIPYFPPGNKQVREQDHIYDWRTDHQVQTGEYELNDFDFESPSSDLTTRSKISPGHAHDAYEIYDYPGKYKDTGVGRSRTDVRMEELHSQYALVQGQANAMGIQAGMEFTLSDFYFKEENVKHVVVSASYMIKGDAVGSGGGAGSLFEVIFVALNSKHQFRSQRIAPKPVISGSQTAIVVGKSGEEIWTDKYGRVKVQFHWDREGQNDENSSCWIRVSYPTAGKKWGWVSLPRMGQEVIVSFLEGDPDKPLITGVVYNAEQMPPYTLPANQTQSGIKTHSSKQGTAQNFNEIRFEDKKDEEHLYIHAEKDCERVVENNDTLKVGFDKKDPGDQTMDVYNHRTTTLEKGNDTLTVKTGNRDTKVSKGNDSLTVSLGNHTIKVGAGSSKSEAAVAIELKVGGNSIKIDQSGITIKGLMVNIQGTTTAEMKSPMTTVKGDGMLTLKGGLTMIN